jgi:hypothetical protein
MSSSKKQCPTDVVNAVRQILEEEFRQRQSVSVHYVTRMLEYRVEAPILYNLARHHTTDARQNVERGAEAAVRAALAALRDAYRRKGTLIYRRNP